METKDQLVNSLKEWIQIDNEMRVLQEQVKKYRDQKKNITSELVNVMRDNEIDCFDINDGKLIYSRSKVKKPINKKNLLSSLSLYFRDDKKAQELSAFILDQREEKINESIRRKFGGK